MISDLGHFSLAIAWILSLYCILGGIVSARQRDGLKLLRSTRVASLWSSGMLIASTVCLGLAFVGNDYSNQFVWQFSNRDMPVIYKWSAIWGGMDGSMLLWAVILSVSIAIVSKNLFRYERSLAPWLITALHTSLIFFLTITLFVTNPFRYIEAPFIPPDGRGLNPLLQNPYMAIHPPMLYLGFTTFAIPYAFCMAALLSNNLDKKWIRYSRRWTLIAWGFLTIGIVLGGHWAYLELGWGGFWAWDPVENSSFLPWLTGTAFLHSVMVQERKGMLKLWNVWLIVLTYGLTVFGTFLTRSGIVQSVHAFASTDIGWVFLTYLAFVFLATVVLILRRKKGLKSERTIESFFSREAAFLVNNLVLLSICFAVFWGVMFPVFSEALTGKKQTTGIPFFNMVTLPLFLLLLLTMGVGPLIAWRKAKISSVVRTFIVPLIIGFLVSLVFIWAGVTSFYPVVSYGLCTFVLLATGDEYRRNIKSQRRSGNGTFLEDTKTVLRKHQTRYGGLIVHVGVIFVTIGITASMAHKIEREFSLSKGESFQAGRFSFTLDDLYETAEKNYNALVANISLYSLAEPKNAIATLKPEMRVYTRNRENTSEVALKMGPREDVYVVLAGLDPSGTRATLKLFINPLQVWLWFGAIIMIIGTLIALLPTPRRKETV